MRQPENQKNFSLQNLSGKVSESEEKILKFWQENKIFEKSVEKPAGEKPKGDFIFYDGPPFATGLPHYGHILASIIKDAVPRYKTMNGWRVPRRWGWDCHGLPVENLIEKELKLETKKEIEKFGLEKFNQAAKESVLRYADEWKKIIPRVGRWVDMENDYRTMDADYTESVWWVFKALYDKGLIYEGYKPMHICPRCETTLANFEVAQGYKDAADISVTVKFKLKNPGLLSITKNANTNIYFLAWTTTPWTLPGNVALAVGNDVKYLVLVKDSEIVIVSEQAYNRGGFDGFYIQIPVGKTVLKGSDLIGLEYEPLFDYYSKDKNLENYKNGWKIYGADFVSVEEGTGIVHIAPAFGEDDMELGKKENLPFIQHVSMDGKFKPEVKDFAGLSVKPKDNPQAADIEIIKWLAKENKLFSKQKITHSYPHCWRCETPLLNYAASSWFVKVTAIKEELLKNNRKINWIPEHLREGRFGKWLEGARDWAISRSRFWGAPIPVWRCQCGETKVIGSAAELKKNSGQSGNKYFVMRHGEAEHNVLNLANSKIENNHFALTEKGRKEAARAAEKLKEKNISLIFSSDFLRTKETAEIAAAALGLEKEKIIFDERLREVKVGIFNGRPAAEYHAYFSSLKEKFTKNPPEGENLTELKNRITGFLYDLDKKYRGKNILIVSHEYPIWMLFAGAEGADTSRALAMKEDKDDFLRYAEVQGLDFYSLPHNQNYELDFHRPFIDEMEFECGCGGKMRRISEVFDCWFESGSMPYGQKHYPFEHKEEFKKNFPAEFIAEGVDQTRGWFYNLLVLSTALFGKAAFKNVVANGIILAEDGQKMSKRLKNYPDPMEVIEKYGADSLRFYLLSSPAVRGESLNFSEKGVDEIHKKVIMRLWNSYQFYELYAGKNLKFNLSAGGKKLKLNNILDKWIIARLGQLIVEVSEAMDKYELDRATRPIGDFVDDLSTWYIRRSRDRFKAERKDKNNAIATTKFVLSEFSKIIAPFAPFLAEMIYQNLGNKNSVHLESFPKIDKKMTDKKLLEIMAETRKICSFGLEARAKAGIKVRQPLQKLKVKSLKLKVKKEFLDLIKDEINVKNIVFDAKIKNEIELDMLITLALKEEGMIRELTRKIQETRKKAGLAPRDKIEMIIFAGAGVKKIIKKHQKTFQKNISARSLEFGAIKKNYFKEELALDNEKIILGLKEL
ncbi:MAG: class I tRNA ligase family protein [Candidatus Niyogibacteria bacterium]|nr:class I tRNA ligase family protein [Candidatus Niyogibacteria bacterium]